MSSSDGHSPSWPRNSAKRTEAKPITQVTAASATIGATIEMCPS